MRLIHRLVPGFVAGSLLLGSAAGAFAAGAKTNPKASPRVLAAGQVSNLSAGTPVTFTLTWTPAKAGATPTTYQVTTTTTTKQTPVKGTSAPLQNGEYAIVIGTRTATGIAADTIRFSTKAFKAREVAILRLRLRLAELTAARAHTVRGTVDATYTVAGTQLAVDVITKTGTKTMTFALSSATKYRVGKAAATSTVPAFTAHEKVAVRFKMNATRTAYDALLVTVPATT